MDESDELGLGLSIDVWLSSPGGSFKKRKETRPMTTTAETAFSMTGPSRCSYIDLNAKFKRPALLASVSVVR